MNLRLNRTTITILAVLVALAGFLTSAVGALIDHRYYALTEDGAAVETWSLSLPGGYQVVKWRSNPPGPQDGYRIFRPD